MKSILLLAGALTWYSGSAVAQQKKPSKIKQKAASPAAAPKTDALGTPSMAAGKAIYAQNCLTCHMDDGGGAGRMNPPLTQTTWVLGDKTRLVKVVLNGMQGEEIDGEVYANVMPAFDALTDQQIADVLTYVRNSFGNKASVVAAPEVKAIRAANTNKK